MMKKFLSAMAFVLIISGGSLFAQDNTDIDINADQQAQAKALDYMLGGVFGAVTIDGRNYQQLGLRPEIKLWKLGIGFDISILLDDEGKVREEDWDEWDDYIDKVYYIRYGQKGDPFYFTYGGLDSTTLGYGTLISGYTNMLEYPTYKRQGLDIGIETESFGMQAIISDFKDLKGSNRAIMGGGRIYVKPFSRLQIGASVAGDTNEYKGLRDTDDDGIPDEVDAYPEDDSFATEIDYYEGHGITDPDVLNALIAAGLLSPVEREDLFNVHRERSQTGFWAGDAGLRILNGDFLKFDIYTQYAQSFNTGGWGFTAPGVRLTFGRVLEIYGDYRQQTEDFIFGYYNNTYDLERAKFVEVDNPASPGETMFVVETKLDKLEAAEKLRGYFGGAKVNILNVVTGIAEYQDMRWGEEDKEDKSLRGELQLNKTLIPMLSKARAYYVQNNVDKLRWKTESTVMGAVVGLGMSEGLSIDFNYTITYEDKNGDGEIEGSDERITNVSISTNAVF